MSTKAPKSIIWGKPSKYFRTGYYDVNGVTYWAYSYLTIDGKYQSNLFNFGPPEFRIASPLFSSEKKAISWLEKHLKKNERMKRGHYSNSISKVK